MNKIIIDNRTDLSDYKSMILVNKVIKQGRISNDNKQYCYGTGITFDDKKYIVWTDLNKRSDRFIIVNDQH